MLLGVIITGFCVDISMTACGGAWDNAKKFMEDRNFGGGYKLTAERRVQMMQNMQKHVEGGK